MLPLIASDLNTSINSLMNYTPNYTKTSHYEEYYRHNDFYWGTTPNSLALNILRFIYPTKPLKLLEIGCGEGRDAIFFTRNGFDVTAFDISETGINKAKQLAIKSRVNVNFFQSDLKNFKPAETYDVIYSSGVLHHITDEFKEELFNYYKDYTSINDFNIFNVFVTKPYIEIPPDSDGDDNTWHSGELLQIYSDWKQFTSKKKK